MNWFQRLIKRRSLERELQKEMQDHLERQVSDYRRSGLSEGETRRKARLTFGGVEQVREACRDARGTQWLESTLQDLRFALRMLRRSPGFASVVIISLALGIGANTAIFSLIDSVMLKTLPVRHPEQLLVVNMGNKNQWGFKTPFYSNPVWEQLRGRQDIFSGIFAYGIGRFNLAPGGEAKFVQGNYASGQFFSTLGLRPEVGRTFTTNEDQRGCAGTAVLSNGFWQSEYGGHASVVGKTISLDNHPFEILGALEPGFSGVDVGRESDLYVPLCAEKIIRGETSVLDRRGAGWLRVIGRPKSGISKDQVNARLETLAGPILKATVPPNLRPDQREIYLKRTFSAQTAANGLSNVRQQYRPALMVLMLVVGVVLLIACANVANLFLARSAARQREIAIRMALGSGRGRLLRQLLTESMLLSLSGAALGTVFAHWGARLLVGFLASNVYQENKVYLDLSIDIRVLAFTAAVAILTGVLFGLAPAWRATRVDPQWAMKANTKSAIEGGRFGLRKTLVVLQIALSLVLVTGAGLMLSTFFRLETLDPGFDRDHVLLADVTLPAPKYAPAQRQAIFNEMLGHLRALPGVRSVSYSDMTPLDGSIDVNYIQIEGVASKSEDAALIYFNWVSDRFFETLDTTLLAGRDFNAHDTPASPKVATLNQAMAKKFFPGQSPIGKRYRPGAGNRLGDPVEIVGVVKDAKSVSLREDFHPTAYLALNQNLKTGQSFTFELRAATNSPTALISAVKSSTAEVNRDVSLQFKTLAVQVDESLARERLLATLSGFFGGLALMLAMIGLYGVTSYSVTQRRHEIGIRVALGAQQSHVLRTVLGEVSILIGLGLAIGLVVTIGTTHFIASFLYGVRPNDPSMLCGAAAMLTLAATTAGFLPARRASRLEPMTTLREE